MKKRRKSSEHEIRPEYDFSAGERGKYAKRFNEGTNLVALAPDVAKDFPNARAVNEALRAYRKIQRMMAKG